MNVKMKKLIRILIPVILLLVSVFILAKSMSTPETYRKTIASLDEKRDTVTSLAGAATTASVMISLIPDDSATPLANEIADLSSWFLIILSAIYVEKYLLTIIGLVVFRFLIPIACVLYIINLFAKSDMYKIIIRKILVISLVFVCVIPASEKVSCMIMETHGASIEATMTLAEKEIEIKYEDEGIAAFFSKIKEVPTDILDWAKHTLGNFINAVAVMMVTSCVIPIAVFLFLFWFIKYTLGLNINLPTAKNLMFMRKGVKKIREIREEMEDIID